MARHHLQLSLNIAARTPPWPDVLGELKKAQLGGRSSQKVLFSPGIIKIFISRRKQEVKKLFRIKVLYATDLGLMRAI